MILEKVREQTYTPEDFSELLSSPPPSSVNWVYGVKDVSPCESRGLFWPYEPTGSTADALRSTWMRVQIDPREPLFDLIRTFYRVKEPAAVVAFLRQYDSLLPVLVEAIPITRSIFGPNTQLELTLWRDSMDGAIMMAYVFIVTRHSRQEARSLLATLDECWWYSVIDRVNDKMMIDVKYA